MSADTKERFDLNWLRKIHWRPRAIEFGVIRMAQFVQFEDMDNVTISVTCHLSTMTFE